MCYLQLFSISNSRYDRSNLEHVSHIRSSPPVSQSRLSYSPSPHSVHVSHTRSDACVQLPTSRVPKAHGVQPGQQRGNDRTCASFVHDVAHSSTHAVRFANFCTPGESYRSVTHPLDY